MDGMSEKNRESELLGGTTTAPAMGLPLLSSETLLKGGNEVLIEHGSCVYSLRVTRQGKLILTK
jgi:hemin uptake protein HemP